MVAEITLSEQYGRAPERFELLDIAQRLSELAHGQADGSYTVSATPDRPGVRRAGGDILMLALRDIERRRARERLLPKGLFGEPGWEMLLDLVVQQSRGRSVSITSLCIASQAPPTTALRHLSLLEEARLVQRREDFFDRRRSFVELSKEGVRAMAQVLSAAPSFP